MSTLVDNYSETNANIFGGMTPSFPKDGNSFACSITGYQITSAKFYLKKTGSPSGNMVAKLYAISGSYGTTSIPTGAALGTSDVINANTLSTSAALVEFFFTGANQAALTNGTNYFITLEFSGGVDGVDIVNDGIDNSSPTHGGNRAYFDTVWNAVDTQDVCFYVYGDIPVTTTSTSTTTTSTSSSTSSSTSTSTSTTTTSTSTTTTSTSTTTTSTSTTTTSTSVPYLKFTVI